MGCEDLRQLLADPSALPVEFLVHVRCELAHRRKAGRHSERVAVVCPALRKVWLSPRVEQLHHVCAAAERRDGQAASDDLAKGGEIWCDAVQLLGSPGSDTK